MICSIFSSEAYFSSVFLSIIGDSEHFYLNDYFVFGHEAHEIVLDHWLLDFATVSLRIP
jgi:hypothetical protein